MEEEVPSMTTRIRGVAVVFLAAGAMACGGPKTEGPPAAVASPAPVTTPAALPAIVEPAGVPEVSPASGAPPVSAAPATTAPAATVVSAPAAATPPTAVAPPSTTVQAAPATTMPAPPTTAAPAPAPPSPAKLATRPEPKGKIVLPAKPGAVTFDHGKHAGELKVACAVCHHPTRPEKPLVAVHQSCRQCHTTPATAPVKTSLQAAFHDPRAATGTCIDCHRKAGAGKKAPVKCLECHVRAK